MSVPVLARLALVVTDVLAVTILNFVSTGFSGEVCENSNETETTVAVETTTDMVGICRKAGFTSVLHYTSTCFKLGIMISSAHLVESYTYICCAVGIVYVENSNSIL